jgi:RNA recognition motif-containing protein
VGNLPFSISDDELKAHVASLGVQADEVVIIKDRDTGQSRGFGFVTTTMDVNEAIEALDGQEVQGRDLRVNEAHERVPRGGSGGGHRSDFGSDMDRSSGNPDDRPRKKRRRRARDPANRDSW